MTKQQQALDFGLSLPDTYQDAPFHDENWQLVRIRKNKKVFFINKKGVDKMIIRILNKNNLESGIYVYDFILVSPKMFNALTPIIAIICLCLKNHGFIHFVSACASNFTSIFRVDTRCYIT